MIERERKGEQGKQVEEGLSRELVGRCANSADTEVFLIFQSIINNTRNL